MDGTWQRTSSPTPVSRANRIQRIAEAAALGRKQASLAGRGQSSLMTQQGPGYATLGSVDPSTVGGRKGGAILPHSSPTASPRRDVPGPSSVKKTPLGVRKSALTTNIDNTSEMDVDGDGVQHFGGSSIVSDDVSDELTEASSKFGQRRNRKGARSVTSGTGSNDRARDREGADASGDGDDDEYGFDEYDEDEVGEEDEDEEEEDAAVESASVQSAVRKLTTKKSGLQFSLDDEGDAGGVAVVKQVTSRSKLPSPKASSSAVMELTRDVEDEEEDVSGVGSGAGGVEVPAQRKLRKVANKRASIANYLNVKEAQGNLEIVSQQAAIGSGVDAGTLVGGGPRSKVLTDSIWRSLNVF